MHGYTPLIGSEAWLSTMGEMRMSSALTSVFYPLPHPQIRTSSFYDRPLPLAICKTGEPDSKALKKIKHYDICKIKTL